MEIGEGGGDLSGMSNDEENASERGRDMIMGKIERSIYRYRAREI